MATTRRIGAETSKTRDLLLDCVMQIMVREGYAAVTYRAVAAAAGVTAGLVQYYFPSHDDLFLGVIRRGTEQNLERLTETLRSGEDGPLRALWEYSQDESMSTLTMEFLALSHHRERIAEELAKVSERERGIELEVLRETIGNNDIHLGPLSPEALLFLLTGIPRLIRLEGGVGVSATHTQVLEAFEAFLERVEPTRGKPKRQRKTSRPSAQGRGRPSK